MNTESKVDFLTIKGISQKRGNFKKFLSTNSFNPGEIFFDLKGSKIDLLISCGDNYIGRIPLERLSVQEYLNFRYPEPKGVDQ